MWVSMSVLSWVWLSVMFFLAEGKCTIYNSPFGIRHLFIFQALQIST